MPKDLPTVESLLPKDMVELKQDVLPTVESLLPKDRIEIPSDTLPTVESLLPQETNEDKSLWEKARYLENKSKEGLDMIIKAGTKFAEKHGYPKVEEAKSPFKAAVIATPGILANTVAEFSSSFLSPEAIGLGALGKGIGKALKIPSVKKYVTGGIAKASKYVPEFLKKGFVYGYGRPEKFMDLKEARHINIQEGYKKAMDVGNSLVKDLPAADRLLVGRIMKGEISAIGSKKALNKLSANARKIIDDLSEQLLQHGEDAGFISSKMASAITANKGKYLPRLFKIFEDKKLLKELTSGEKTLFEALPDAKLLSKKGVEQLEKTLNKAAPPIEPYPAKGIRLRTPFLKHRKDLGKDYKKALGEVLEPALPAARAISRMTHTVETSRLFNAVANNPNWVSEVAKKGFVQVKGTPRTLGRLSNKWVHPGIADDLSDIVRSRGAAEKAYAQIHNAWKFGKVVINPGTHARNLMSNSILLDLSGVGHFQQARLLPKALLDLKNKGKYFKEQQPTNLLGHEFFGGEINSLFQSTNGGAEKFGMNFALRGLNAVSENAGKIYQAEEQWFKLAKFIAEREKGASIVEAAKQAEKWLFNYSKVPKAIEWLRRSPFGSPFITFSSKALPRVVEAGFKNPLRLYKYEMMFNAMDNVAQETLGLKDDDVKTIKRNLRGKGVILPWKDQNGLSQSLDLSFILPWGDFMPHSGGLWEGGGLAGFPPIAPPSGPMKALFELGFNKSMFRDAMGARDSRIYNKQEAKLDIFTDSFDFLYKAMFPSLATEIPGLTRGGYSYDRLKSAIMRRPGYLGRIQSIPSAAASTLLGLKTIPHDIKFIKDMEIVRFTRIRGEIFAERNKTMRNKSMYPKEREKELLKLRNRYDNLIEEYKEKQ